MRCGNSSTRSQQLTVQAEEHRTQNTQCCGMHNTSANTTRSTICYRLLTGTVHMSVAAQLCYHRSNSASKPTDTVLCGLLIDMAIPDGTTLTQRNWKTQQVQRPADVESEDKSHTSYNCNCSVRNNYEGIRPEPSAARRSSVGHRATEGHTNEKCTHHSVSAGRNRFDLLLRYGLTSRPPPDNW